MPGTVAAARAYVDYPEVIGLPAGNRRDARGGHRAGHEHNRQHIHSGGAPDLAVRGGSCESLGGAARRTGRHLHGRAGLLHRQRRAARRCSTACTRASGAIEWVVAGYSLTSAVFLITAARLGDQLGRRRVVLARARRCSRWPRRRAASRRHAGGAGARAARAGRRRGAADAERAVDHRRRPTTAPTAPARSASTGS